MLLPSLSPHSIDHSGVLSLIDGFPGLFQFFGMLQNPCGYQIVVRLLLQAKGSLDRIAVKTILAVLILLQDQHMTHMMLLIHLPINVDNDFLVLKILYPRHAATLRQLLYVI